MSADTSRPLQGDPFVLLVSDRPSERAVLSRAISLVMDCQTIEPGDPAPRPRPILAVLDIVPDSLTGWLRQLDDRSPPVRRVALLRGETGREDPNTRFIPATAPRQMVLSQIFAAIEAATKSSETQARRLQARVRAATGIVSELFDSAALGDNLGRTELERGTDLVLAAISEVGISAWLAELWRHDFSVYEHTLSVAGYCAAFGARIGLARTDLARLARAALLHDIGKARIPKEILDKPGRLDQSEERLMRRHPEIGASLLRSSGGFEAEVIDAVLHHHERLDGKGYPDGLSGRQIPDLVRIISICDVFSALTEKRTYQRSSTPAEALAIMAESSGHLDPILLSAFAPAMLACETVPA